MMKPQFDFMIIISHLESMRDMVDHIIEIKKEDGYSSINI
jgi:DNA repair exonuclease SbcCD ATPase subunit